MIIEENKPINKNFVSNFPDNSVQIANKITDNIKMFVSICLVRPRIGIMFLLVGISILEYKYNYYIFYKNGQNVSTIKERYC